MKFLAIDVGTKKHGLSISDPDAKFALPYLSFDSQNKKEDTNKIVGIIIKEKIDAVVIGLPKKIDGTDTDMTQVVKSFSKLLENKLKSNSLQNIKFYFQNELLTTKTAGSLLKERGIHNKKEQKNMIDSLAATVILNDFLEEWGRKINH